MNLKKDLKDLALYSITPFPAKYHFEGVNNKRAATQLIIGLVAANVALFGVVFVGPIVVDKTVALKNRAMKRLNKH